jgi:deoxyribonuclease V
VRWPKTIAGAKRAQKRLAAEVEITPLEKIPEFIAAADAAFSGDRVFAVASLFSYPGLALLEEATVSAEADFPYVPGYLTFREGPSIIRAIRQLKKKPDVLLVDGQGIAHPRRMGIAAHIGVLLDIPTIGCAKSRLVGEHEEPGVKKGCWSPLRYKKETVGAVLRTRDSVRPVFVSPGHRIDLEDSLKIVLACTRNFRIPEPLRRVDFLSKKRKRDEKYSASK